MRRYLNYSVLIFILFFVGVFTISAADFTCAIDGYDVGYNTSGKIVSVSKNGELSSSYNGSNVVYYSGVSPKSASECPNTSNVQVMTSYIDGKYEFRVIVNAESTTKVSSCAEFIKPKKCLDGQTANGKIGCAWNDKYEFCSPTGLAYLSCGSGKTDAHDIPVMVPQLTSYFILILKTATPIVLIIIGMVQIIKAIASTNEDEINKARSALIKKLIAAVLVFFSISIVQFVVDQVVDDDEAGSVAACMNCFINNDCKGSIYYTDGYGKCYYLSSKYTAVDCNTDIGNKVNKK